MTDLGFATVLAVIACVIGGALGGYAIARPDEVMALVGLRRDEGKAHSVTEVRSTYGGLFVMSHAGTAAMLGYFPTGGAYMAFALSLAWLGAALGRGYSMARQADERTAFNIRAAVFEVLMAVSLSLPFYTVSATWRGGATLV